MILCCLSPDFVLLCATPYMILNWLLAWQKLVCAWVLTFYTVFPWWRFYRHLKWKMVAGQIQISVEQGWQIQIPDFCNKDHQEINYVEEQHCLKINVIARNVQNPPPLRGICINSFPFSTLFIPLYKLGEWSFKISYIPTVTVNNPTVMRGVDYLMLFPQKLNVPGILNCKISKHIGKKWPFSYNSLICECSPNFHNIYPYGCSRYGIE